MFDSLAWELMNATADDRESLEQLVSQVRRFRGSVDPATAAEVVAGLVGEGLMEEMRGVTIEPAAVVADPSDYWFRMTPTGRSV